VVCSPLRRRAVLSHKNVIHERIPWTQVRSIASACPENKGDWSERILRDRLLSTTKLEADMERPAEIGASIVIKGDMTAREDVVISGRVEGSITVEGHSVTVKDGAQLVADIKARTILIGGEVMGILVAAESIELQPSADVEGELTASALRVHEGAVFTGKAHTTKARSAAKLQLAS
jgi:cytoskeletal protein CcmA (bactofilin family)